MRCGVGAKNRCPAGGNREPIARGGAGLERDVAERVIGDLVLNACAVLAIQITEPTGFVKYHDVSPLAPVRASSSSTATPSR